MNFRPARDAGRGDLGGWVLRGGIGLSFVLFGFEKLNTGLHNPWVDLFARIGLGQWFRVATGGIEGAGGLLFVAPRTCRVGAVMLAATMVGAMLAHITILGDPIASVMPAAAFIAVVMVAARDPSAESIERWRIRVSPDR